jgi:hypothetical protein
LGAHPFAHPRHRIIGALDKVMWACMVEARSDYIVTYNAGPLLLARDEKAGPCPCMNDHARTYMPNQARLQTIEHKFGQAYA